MVFSVIGWTIIHSLWQCLGLLAGLKLFLAFFDVRRSRVRYAAVVGVLGLAVVGVLGTLVWEWRAFVPGSLVSGTAAGGGAIAPVVGAASAQGGVRGYGALAFLARACPYLTVGWVLGVVIFGGRLVLSGLELRRLRRSIGVPDAACFFIILSSG